MVAEICCPMDRTGTVLERGLATRAVPNFHLMKKTCNSDDILSIGSENVRNNLRGKFSGIGRGGGGGMIDGGLVGGFPFIPVAIKANCPSIIGADMKCTKARCFARSSRFPLSSALHR